jgi:hypothetical protein
MSTENPQAGNPNLLHAKNVVGHRLEIMHRLQNSLDPVSELSIGLIDRYDQAHDQIYNSSELTNFVDSTPNLIGRIANQGVSTNEINLEGLGHEPLVITEAFRRVANGIQKAKEYYPAIRTKLEEDGGRYEKDLFRDLSAHVLLTIDATTKVKKYEDNGFPVIDSIGKLLSNSQTHLSTEPGASPLESLAIDALPSEGVTDLEFMFATISRAHQRIQSRLIGKDNRDFTSPSLAKCLEGYDTAYDNYRNLVNTGALSFEEMTALQSNALDLANRIKSAHLPNLPYEQIMAEVNVREISGGPEDKANTRNQQIELLSRKASEINEQANARVTEVERALELARANAAETNQLMTSVDELVNRNKHLQELENMEKSRRSVHEGLAEDPEVKAKELEALTLEPPFEEPSEDFYRTLAQIDPGKIAAVYEIDMQQIEPSIKALREACDLIGGTTPAALLRPILDHHKNSLWETIGQEKLSTGRERLKEASQPVEGMEQLEAEITQRMRQLSEEIGE